MIKFMHQLTKVDFIFVLGYFSSTAYILYIKLSSCTASSFTGLSISPLVDWVKFWMRSSRVVEEI